MKKLIIFLLIPSLFACQQNIDAEKVVDHAIESAGGKNYENSRIQFDFRDIHYSIKRQDNSFVMERKFEKDGDSIIDTYSNSGFDRKINNQITAVSDSMASLYQQSINSVFYFALLPYKLNDKAVIKEYQGMKEINEQSFHQIKVRFQQAGGGTDFEDEFLYWFDKKDFSLDYLAYSYHTDGGGVRFREAFNERNVNGIRFMDYKNYKPSSKSTDLNELLQLYKDGQLELLSKIELKNIEVVTN